MASGDGTNFGSLGIYMNKLKSDVPLWEDMILKSQKFNSNLKNTIQGINLTLESLTSICKNNDKSYHSGIEEIEKSLIDLCCNEKRIADKVSVLNNSIQNNLSINLSFHIENWKRSITNLKKERDLSRNKAKLEYNRALAELKKVDSKISKRVKSTNTNYLSESVSVQLDYANQNLNSKLRFIEELEKCSLRKAISEERNRYRQFLECLRPILEAQLSMKADLDELQLIYDKLYSFNIEDLATMPSEVDAFVKQYQVSDVPRVNSFSSLYSCTNSQSSLSSSRCSSLETGFVKPLFLNSYGTEISILEDSHDLSSSTIYDLKNVPPPTPPQTVNENNDSYENSINEQSLNNGITASEFLYPNQLIPPPCYSNLRELQQNADKKYKTKDFYGNAIKNLPLTKRWSLINNYDTVQNFPEYAQVSSVQDCNSYSTIFNIDNKFANISSGTSTFRRRKPSVIKEMNVPVILGKEACYNSNLDHDNILKKEFRYSADLNYGEMTTACAQLERLSCVPRKLSNEIVDVTFPDCQNQVYPKLSQDWTKSNDLIPQKLLDTMKESDQPSGCKTNSLFKQQLLKVIQGDRPEYHKHVPPVSNRMF